MAILRVIHLPFREGEIGVWVETRNLEVLGEECPEASLRLSEVFEVIGYHQHIEGDDNDEGDEGEDPFFFLYLKDVVFYLKHIAFYLKPIVFILKMLFLS